ncbi:unnamed protein product [Owenia fusiformis]|uniref:Glycosyltransferase family 92 protein n=1 Tax=Owenia fusiformis TaxID=6347 RepID=A0A8S4N9Q3_OWEFU|nr:unnamed protein product [Owenia fusiformis]
MMLKSKNKKKIGFCLILGTYMIFLLFYVYIYWKGARIGKNKLCINSIVPPVLLNFNECVTHLDTLPNLTDTHIWQQVGNAQIWIYSAYYEETSHGDLIRLLVMKDRRLNRHLSCLIQYKDGASVCVSKGAILENIEAYQWPVKPHQGDFYVCKVPNYLSQVSHVTISENCDCSDITNKVKVHHQKLESKIDFGVCLEGALYGNISADLIIESIEFNKMMGAQKIIVYIESVQEHIMPILQYYQKQGILEYIEWKTKRYLKNLDIFYYGQPLLLNDCLYKMKHHTKYVTFVDIDEFLMPYGDANTWKDLIQEYSNRNSHTAAWLAQNSFFIKPPKNLQKNPAPSVLSHTYRSLEYFEPPIRSKYIARVDMIKSAGVHKPLNLQVGYKYDKLSPDIAQLHHMKQEAEIETQHGFKEDLSAQKYAKSLTRAVLEAKENISKFI